MKNLLFLSLALILSFIGYSQTITQDEIDKLQKGVPFKTFSKYIDSNGNEYNVGDTLTIGTGYNNGRFVHIKSTVLLEEQPISPSLTGTNVIIKRMAVTGSARSGFKLHITTKIHGVSTYYFWLNDAISHGEVMGKGMNSDQALIELKKCKDKLDLGLISEEEFNVKRNELSKFIK
jgi:hypothetical protein